MRFSMLISSLPGANSRFPEHKIGVFVLFWPSQPSFSGISSTKSRFLCAFCLRDPHFRAFQAQKSTFCTILPSRTPDFRLFEHKIEVFVRFWGLEPLFSGFSSTKLAFLCSRCWESSIGKPENKCIHLDTIPDGDSLAKRHPHPASNICAPARRQPHPAEIRRWRRQSAQMGRQICYV